MLFLIPVQISVTHNSNEDKQSITARWTAPPAGTGPVRIRYTLTIEGGVEGWVREMM